MEQRIVFTGKRQAQLEDFTPREIGPEDVKVRAMRTLISIGTETICYNRAFAPGTHWDQWVQYPFYPGYSFGGVVEEAGSAVKSLRPGDRVACKFSHASAHVAPARDCFAVPEGIDLGHACWLSLAQTTHSGSMASEQKLGDRVLVIGAGPIGQLSVRWAAAQGASVLIAVDPVAMRLEMARQGGATHVFARPVKDALADIQAAGGGELPDIVIDTTGNFRVLAEALPAVRDFGRYVILGDTGTPGEQHLTSDVIRRGIRIVGAHGMHQHGRWTKDLIMPFFFSLVGRGRFPMEGLETHRFAPRDFQKAYDLVSDAREQAMGVYFDW